MTTGDDTIVRRYADAMQRRGTQIVHRIVTAAGGLNPPTIAAAVVNGATAAGATAIAIRAASASGRIVQGDTLTIGTLAANTVAATASATQPPVNPGSGAYTPGFASVALTTPLAAAVADGAPIAFAWQADTQAWAAVESYVFSLAANGITAGDLDIEMAAYGVTAPTTSDQLVVAGTVRSIVASTPVFQRGLIVAYKIHAR